MTALTAIADKSLPVNMLINYYLKLLPQVKIQSQLGVVMLSYLGLTLCFDDKANVLINLLFYLKNNGGKLDDLTEKFSLQLSKAAIIYLLEYLAQHGLLNLSVVNNENQCLITLEPMTEYALLLNQANITDETKISLSRFAYLRTNGSCFILETPLGHAMLHLHEQSVLLLISKLTQPCRITDLHAQLTLLSDSQITDMINLLMVAKAIVRCDGTHVIDTLQNWDFHDLLFHSRTRVGRHNYAIGKKPELNNTNHLTIYKLPCLQTIPLPAVNIKDFIQTLAFDEILKKRQSLRHHSEQTITIEQLSAFLQCCRITSSHDPRVDLPSSRAYPSAGGSYELEIYIASKNNRSLQAGFYHYNADEHVLELISIDKLALNKMLQRAKRATGKMTKIDLLIILAARFDKINAHYDAIAYSLILKNVGVLLQTFYLVATSMNLAPCALGTGDSDLFAQVTGLDCFQETSVGEFLLGRR